MNPIKGILFSFTGIELRKAFLFQSKRCETQAQQAQASLDEYLKHNESTADEGRQYPQIVLDRAKNDCVKAFREAKMAVFMADHIVSENTYLLDIAEFKEMGFTNWEQFCAMTGESAE